MHDPLVTNVDTPAPASPRVAHLLNVAWTAFVADGFDRVSIDGIARDAGVSKETIYRFFPDKQALFRAALEDMASRFAVRAQALHRAGLPLGEELDALARAIMDSAIDGGLLSPLWLAAGLGQRMPDFAAELQQQQAARMEPVREAIEAFARAKGVTRAVPIDDAFDFGSLSVEGSALLMGFDPPSSEQRAAVARRVAALFAYGVLGMPDGPALDADPAQSSLISPLLHPPHLRRLLDVSADHFVRDGYEAANLGAIGTEAKVGRGTLYRHFAHKAGLFDAVLRDLAAQLAARACPPELDEDTGLARYFAAATAHLTGAASTALHRAAISNSRHHPALARAVHDTVRAPWIGPLAAWITQRTGQGDAHWLARQGIVLAMQGNRAIAAGHGPVPEMLEAHAARVGRLFLHGFAG